MNEDQLRKVLLVTTILGISCMVTSEVAPRVQLMMMRAKTGKIIRAVNKSKFRIRFGIAWMVLRGRLPEVSI